VWGKFNRRYGDYCTGGDIIKSRVGPSVLAARPSSSSQTSVIERDDCDRLVGLNDCDQLAGPVWA
jgi:hypothetical protein